MFMMRWFVLGALCAGQVSTLAGQVVSREELAERLAQMEPGDITFETTFTVTLLGKRPASEERPWDPNDWFMRREYRMTSAPHRLRTERVREEEPDANRRPRHVVQVFDGRVSTVHEWHDREYDIRITSKVGPLDPYLLEQFRFNLIEQRYPKALSWSCLVARGSVLDQRLDNGVLTHRFYTGSLPNAMQHELVARLEPEFRFISHSIMRSDAENVDEFDDHIFWKIVYQVDEWETYGETTLPKRAYRDGYGYENRRERTGRWLSSRTIYERTGFRDLSEEPPPASTFVLPPVFGAHVSDEENDLLYTLGEADLSVEHVNFDLDEPILQLLAPGKQLATLVAKAAVHVPGERRVGGTGFEWTDPGGATRPGDAIRDHLRQLEAQRPDYDFELARDPDWRAVYQARSSLYTATRAMLIGELLRAEPGAPELTHLLPYRWKHADRLVSLDFAAEIEASSSAQGGGPELVRTGRLWASAHQLTVEEVDLETATEAVNAFIEEYPDDPHGARLLFLLALRQPDELTAFQIKRRLAEAFPNTYEGMHVKSSLRKVEGVGEEFKLQFTDRLSGRVFSMEDLRGQLVVVDFWATWCGPCVQSLPELKKIYERYHHRGVEFVGVSLDIDPQKVIDFCREAAITWPQHCEPGKGWNTEIARTWGVTGIPQFVVIDRQGKVRSTDAELKGLEGLIAHLLKE